ncbi:MAG: acyl--CoA ligase [Candidatus Omnitrophica bacterium]|nr:acyl--CoA ligase [Candidatus Omnitrophota bacterium]
MQIRELLQKNATSFSEKSAIIFKEQRISFLELKELSFRLASSLSILGVKRNDKVAVYLPNCPEYLYSYLAVWCTAATIVPLDFMLTEDELVSCIAHCGAKILIAKPKATVCLEKIKKSCPKLEYIIFCDQHTDGYMRLDKLLSKANVNPPSIDADDKDQAIIFYTSGTTGKPKGVLINYLQLAASPKAMEYFAELKAEDIALCALPLSHLGGMLFLQSAIFFGTTVVLMERFIPLEFLKNVQDYRVTCFWLVPPMYYAFLQLKEFESFDLSSLKWIVSFGAPGSAEQLRRFHTYCPNAHLLHGWGMTETNAPNAVLPKGSQKIESVGRVAPWIELKIVDDNDREVLNGEIGEIVVRGWVVTEGYYKDPELTSQTMRGGWFHTGDLGKFDEEGFLYIVGRKKEMIKVAGEIVFEPEVESVIHRHPDVVEVAVVGVPDKLRGEVPKAFIVLKENSRVSEEEMRYFCRQHLAHFKIPHYFEFRSALPKNRTGKIDKESLRGAAQLRL